MKKHFILILLLGFLNGIFAQSDSLTVDFEAYQRVLDSISNSLVYQRGHIELQDGIAGIAIPEGYKFLDATQSAFVLTDLWGNPPSEVLGLMFPENIGPLSDSFTYAVEITYSEEGYIDDEDAASIPTGSSRDMNPLN
jgi:uncharacterized membrane-anchored protein